MILLLLIVIQDIKFHREKYTFYFKELHLKNYTVKLI